MAQQWRTERTFFEMGMGKKKNPKLGIMESNVVFNEMTWDLFKQITDKAYQYADRADRTEQRISDMGKAKIPNWTRDQRAQFVLAWNHKDLTSTEMLKIWLADLPQMSKQSHADLGRIATALIIGEDNTKPHLKSYCTQRKYRKKVYYVLTNKPHRTSPLTDADLKRVKFTPPK